MQIVNTLMPFLVLSAGAYIGSLLNVWITYDGMRWDHVFYLRRICPSCRSSRKWMNCIPIVGWLFHQGRLSCCHRSLPLRYLIVEICFAAFALGYWLFPPSGNGVIENGQFSFPGLVTYILYVLFTALLLINSFSDIEEIGVSDSVVEIGVVVGCLGGLMVPGFAGFFHIPVIPKYIDSFLFSLSGIIAGAGIAQAVRLVGTLAFKKEGLGFGVVTHMGMIGAFLGWKMGLVAFFVAPFIGILSFPIFGLLKRIWDSREKINEVSYTVSLSIAAILCLYFKSWLIQFYEMKQDSGKINYSAVAVLGVLLGCASIYGFYTAILEKFRNIRHPILQKIVDRDEEYE